MEEHKDIITYDENWQSVSEPEYPVVRAPQDGGEESETVYPEKRRRQLPKQPVLVLQLILCLMLALAAFVLKGMGGELYDAVRQWYTDNLNRTAVFDGKLPPSLSHLFTATADEV